MQNRRGRSSDGRLWFGDRRSGHNRSGDYFAKRSGAVAIRLEYAKFRAFFDVELARFAGQGLEVHGVDYLLTSSVSAGYGLTDDLTVGLRLPYLLRGDIREGHLEDGVAEIHSHGDSDGVGDLTFLGQYRFLNLQSLNL